MFLCTALLHCGKKKIGGLGKKCPKLHHVAQTARSAVTASTGTCFQCGTFVQSCDAGTVQAYQVPSSHVPVPYLQTASLLGHVHHPSHFWRGPDRLYGRRSSVVGIPSSPPPPPSCLCLCFVSWSWWRRWLVVCVCVRMCACFYVCVCIACPPRKSSHHPQTHAHVHSCVRVTCVPKTRISCALVVVVDVVWLYVGSVVYGGSLGYLLSSSFSSYALAFAALPFVFKGLVKLAWVAPNEFHMALGLS